MLYTTSKKEDGDYGLVSRADIIVDEVALLDYEYRQGWTLEVIARDQGGLKQVINIGIRVNNVDDLSVDTIELIPELNGAISKDELLTGGDERIKFIGKNFGVLQQSVDDAMHTQSVPVVTYQRDGSTKVFEAYECVVDTPTGNVAMTCKTAEGYGSKHRWTVKFKNSQTNTVEGTYTTPPDVTTSYATPTISSFSLVAENSGQTVNTLSTSGGTFVLLTGTNMGPLGMETCSGCQHMSASLHLVGYYGTNGGGFCATNCKVTIKHTQIRCKTSPGIGTLHSWRLRQPDHDVYGVSSIQTTSYATPSIDDVQCWTTDSSTGVQIRCPHGDDDNDDAGRVFSTHGTDRVKIVGKNFGPEENPMGTAQCNPPNNVLDLGAKETFYSLQWNNGDGGYQYLQDATCYIEQDHEILNCLTQPGVGKEFKWQVTVASQTSAESTVLTRYRIPELKAVRGTGAFGASTVGNEVLYLEGDFFGPLDRTKTIAMKYGRENLKWFDTTCIHEERDSQRLLSCITIPGAGHLFSYEVTIADQISHHGKFNGNYAPPVLFSMTPAEELLTNGGEIVTIFGQNFGPNGPMDHWNIVTATYGDDAEKFPMTAVRFPAHTCNITQAHKEIQCRTNEGAGSLHNWLLYVSDQVNQMPSTSYGRPRIWNIVGDWNQEEGPATNGNEKFILIGQNFGPPTHPFGSLNIDPRAFPINNTRFLESFAYGRPAVPAREPTSMTVVVEINATGTMGEEEEEKKKKK